MTKPDETNLSNSDIPCGDSPPMPWWPVWVAAACWLAWIVFLIAMVFVVLRTPPT